MKTHALTLSASAFVLACGAVVASAQPDPGGPMMQQRKDMMQRGQQDDQTTQRRRDDDRDRQDDGQDDQTTKNRRDEDRDRQNAWRGPGMMGYVPGWRRHRDSAPGAMELGMMGRGVMGPGMMRMMIILMDTDSDGAVSLQEFQAVHERIFKALDANGDGRLSLEEMQAFRLDRGNGPPQQ